LSTGLISKLLSKLSLNWKLMLLVVGPGLFTDYGEKIKELARKRGVSEKVKFTGAVPYEKLGTYISAMDIGLKIH